MRRLYGEFIYEEIQSLRNQQIRIFLKTILNYSNFKKKLHCDIHGNYEREVKSSNKRSGVKIGRVENPEVISEHVCT